MKFVEIKENLKSAYQSLVQANGSFLQDFEWGEFQKTQGRDIRRFGIIEEHGNFSQGAENFSFIGQGYFSNTAGKSYFFMPYGPVTAKGFDDPENFFSRMEFFGQELKKIRPKLIFIRFEPVNFISPA